MLRGRTVLFLNPDQRVLPVWRINLCTLITIIGISYNSQIRLARLHLRKQTASNGSVKFLRELSKNLLSPW